MNHRSAGRIPVAILLAAGSSTLAFPALAAGPPFVLEKSLTIPDVPVGPYAASLAIDLVGRRIFSTPQSAKAVAVIDLETGRVLKMLPVGNPHGLFFSPTLQRLFVTDGAAGDQKIFSTQDYSLIKTIPLTAGTDVVAYDPKTKYIYANNGGDDAGIDHAVVSAIDSVRMEKVADIPIPTADLEGSVVDSDRQLLYVEGESAVFVVDLRTRKVVRTWETPAGHRTKAIALDTTRGRLYLACRDSGLYGSIIVLDTAGGRVVATLPIGGWAGGISIDHKRNRIYVSAGVGRIETYSIESNDVYFRQPPVDTDIMAKTSLYSSELDRMFVSVPHLGDYGAAEIMEFKPL